jgi:hypothetical protein
MNYATRSFVIFYSVHFLVGIVYLSTLKVTYPDMNDARNYFLALKYLENNSLDLSEIRQFFGRSPEFIYALLLNAIQSLVEIRSVKDYLLLMFILCEVMIFFSFKNIYNKKIFHPNNKINSFICSIILISIPAGYVVQTSRQAFCFWLLILISSLFIDRKIKRTFLIIVTIFTHVSTVLTLPLINFLISKKTKNTLKYCILIVIVAIIFITVSLALKFEFTSIFWYYGVVNVLNFGAIRYEIVDPYYTIPILMLFMSILLTGVVSSKHLIALFVIFIFTMVHANVTVINRILYGLAWFWLPIIIVHILEIKSQKHIRFLNLGPYALAFLIPITISVVS